MENQIYIVQEKDTIPSVAELFGIKILDLIQANPQLENVYQLTPGSQLIIPTSVPLGFTYYTVEKGDNLYQIAKKHHINLEDLVAINGLENANYIYPNQKLLVPEEGVFAYITKEGDTLVDVSKSLGIEEEDILTFNPRIYLLEDQLIAYKIRDNNQNT